MAPVSDKVSRLGAESNYLQGSASQSLTAATHPWHVELQFASSDITLELISLLEASVDAWNLQATRSKTLTLVHDRGSLKVLVLLGTKARSEAHICSPSRMTRGSSPDFPIDRLFVLKYPEPPAALSECESNCCHTNSTFLERIGHTRL